MNRKFFDIISNVMHEISKDSILSSILSIVVSYPYHMVLGDWQFIIYLDESQSLQRARSKFVDGLPNLLILCKLNSDNGQFKIVFRK